MKTVIRIQHPSDGKGLWRAKDEDHNTIIFKHSFYSEAAIIAGLKHFVFDFNSGMDNDIHKFITWLKKRADVTIVNKEE